MSAQARAGRVGGRRTLARMQARSAGVCEALAAAGAWACGVRATQAWARLCTPRCAQLGQVGCFMHSDSIFDPI